MNPSTRQVPCPSCGHLLEFSRSDPPAKITCSGCGRTLKIKKPTAASTPKSMASDESPAKEPAAASQTSPAPVEIPPQPTESEPAAAAPAVTQPVPPIEEPAPAQATPNTAAATGPIPPHLVPPASDPEPEPTREQKPVSEFTEDGLPKIVVDTPKRAPRLSEDGSPMPPTGRRRGMGWVTIVLGSGTLLLLMAGSVAAIYLALSSEGWELSRSRNNPTQEDPSESSQQPVEPTWTDASRFTARLYDIKVKVQYLKYTTVELEGEDSTTQMSSESYLQVNLTANNQRRRPVEFTSWSANVFETESGEKVSVRLVDDSGHEYVMKQFGELKVVGPSPGPTLPPREEVRDRLCFEVPEGVDLDKVSYWRLELPAAAMDRAGAFYFEIPRKMLAQSLGDTPPATDEDSTPDEKNGMDEQEEMADSSRDSQDS